MPEADSNVVLSMLGSLGNVATADAGTLDDVPIRNDSKELVSRFFGASTSDDTPIEEDKMEHSNEDQFYDNIDDSELLECPDPSTVDNRRQETSHRTPFPTRDFQTTTNRPVVQNHQSFSGNIDFTPMVSSRPPSRQQPGYNATPSIFPESFTQQSHFPQPHSMGGYRQRTNSNGYSFSSNYPNIK